MNISKVTAAPDESEKARDLIAAAISRGDDHIDHATARLVAATLHPGAGTALERFAATGHFDVVTLERELRINRYPFPQELWRGVLLSYVGWQRTRQPWMRGISAKQRQRLLAVDRALDAQSGESFSEGERETARNVQHKGQLGV